MCSRGTGRGHWAPLKRKISRAERSVTPILQKDREAKNNAGAKEGRVLREKKAKARTGTGDDN